MCFFSIVSVSYSILSVFFKKKKKKSDKSNLKLNRCARLFIWQQGYFIIWHEILQNTKRPKKKTWTWTFTFARVGAGSVRKILKPSVRINGSGDDRTLKFEVCIVHHLYLSANLNKGLQQDSVVFSCFIIWVKPAITFLATWGQQKQVNTTLTEVDMVTSLANSCLFKHPTLVSNIQSN